MEISKINLVYFSATYTTKKILKQIAGRIGDKIIEYDITQNIPKTNILFGNKDLLIVGMPVYAGRIPSVALDALAKFKGENTVAIIVCVYGNRDYDDALLELKDKIEPKGFRIVSAGAFIAQHSIFPEVGRNRPDEKDIELINEFGDKSAEIIAHLSSAGSLPPINIKGNNPYKIPGEIPLKPKGNKNCNECGTCVKLCPVQAIPEDTPRKTEKEKCISCGRCIVVCPQNARSFGGVIYKLAESKFVKAHSARKEPEMMYVSPS